MDLALRSVLVIPNYSLPAEFLVDSPCLASSYFGTYGGNTAVFLPEIACAVDSVSINAGFLEEGHISVVSEDTYELVWVQEMAVEDGSGVSGEEAQVMVDEGMKTMMRELRLEREAEALLSRSQQVVIDGDHNDEDNHHNSALPEETFGIEILYKSPSSYLFALRGFSSPVAIDRFLPASYKPYVLSSTPHPYTPVSQDRVAAVRALLEGLEYSETIASLVDTLSVSQMRDDVRFLTGEDGEDESKMKNPAPLRSRHSFHPDSRRAAAWIKETVESTGANCTLKPFLPGFAPNVVCQYDGSENTTALVLFSAHYDSRGSFGSTRAPGGDDDGSGTTAILSLARAIKKNGIKFRSNVQLVLFAGEEQGLYGSKAYAREMKEADANITLMVQADMLAYHKPGEQPQLGLPDRIGTPEVAQLISNMSYLYSPELEVGFSPACCSDHQSFWENGYASSQLFERAGPIADPMYHNSGDLSEREGYDLEQLRSIAKVQLATLLHATGFDLPKRNE